MTTPNPPEDKAAGASPPQQGGQPKTLQEAWGQLREGVREAAEKARRERKKPPPELRIWQWTLVPLFLAAVRILVVSRGNSDTARALLENLNVPAIFMATVLPIIAAGAVLLMSLAVITVANQFRNRHERAQQGKPKNEWLQSAILSVILLIFAGVFVWYAMPWRYIIVTAVLVAVLVAVVLGSWLSNKLDRFFSRLGGLYLLSLMVAAIVIVLAQTGVWLPREQLTINGDRSGVVYVLSSDDRWTKYMDDGSRLVEIVPSDSITRREAVHVDMTNWLNQTPSQWVSG